MLEIAAHDFVDLGEMREVGEEDIQLDDVLERATGCFGHGLQVFEYLYGLCFEALHQFHGLRVQWDLPGHVHGIAGLDRLGIGADSRWGLVAGDHALAHGNSCLYEGDIEPLAKSARPV